MVERDRVGAKKKWDSKRGKQGEGRKKSKCTVGLRADRV